MRIDTDRNRYYTNIIYPPLSSPSLALPNLAWPVLAEPILEAMAACPSIPGAVHRPPHRKKRNIVTVNAKIIVTASKNSIR